MTKTISSRNFRSTVEMCFEFGPTWNNFLFNSLYIMGRQLIEKRLDLIFLCRIFTRGRLGDLLGLLGPKNLDKKLDFSGDFSIKNWPNATWIWPFMINNNNNKTFLRIFFSHYETKPIDKIKWFSDAVSSQKPNAKNFFTKKIITYFDQSRPNSSRFVKKYEKKKFAKILRTWLLW